MKIHKTLALAVAVAMIVSIMPAFGLTAFAAVGDGIILSDGVTAYVLNSDNLITDGSFETDAWEKALTTGVYDEQENGVAYVGVMNQDERMLQRGATAFERVAGYDGSYAIVAVTDDISPKGDGSRLTNYENGPTSIKHYIQNTSGSEQKYLVRFWVKAAGEEAAPFKYYVGANTATAAIPSYETGAASDEWKQIETVCTVPASQYVMINIYDMTANSVALDAFEVYALTETADSKAFTEAMAEWSTAFPYLEGQSISEKITLPKKVGNASVVWDIQPTGVIAADGTITAPAEDTKVTLTATISAGSFSAPKTYNLVVKGFGSGLVDALKAVIPGSVTDNVTLPSSVPGYDGSTVTWKSSNTAIIGNDGSYTAPADKTKVTLTATITYSGATVTQDFEVSAGVLKTLVPNGGFETTDLSGWTNRFGNSIDGAEVVYDDTLGANVLHLDGTDGTGTNRSIGTTWSVTTGVAYVLSFDIYINNMDPVYNGITDAVGDGPATGSTGLSGTKIVDFSTEVNTGSWNHIEKQFIAATDLLYYQASWTGELKLGNVKLWPVQTDFTTSVTINYLDRDTGNKLKDSKTVENLDGANDGSISYTAGSSEKAYIEYGGHIYTYDSTSVDSVVLKSNGNVIDLYFKLTDNLMTNGDFESALVGTTIPGWTVGTGNAMTTSNFEIVTEGNGNHYLKSISHESGDGAGSIKTFVDLEPGKVYTISFDIWYTGDGPDGVADGPSEESYIGAYLVDSTKADITTGSDAVINERRETTGGIIPQASNQKDMYLLKNSDGWTTVSTTLYPNETYQTLLIMGKWLNRKDNGQTDGRWAFDNFVIQTVKAEFKGEVTINYLEKGTDKVLKAARTVADQYGDTTYYAAASDKEAITTEDGTTYIYDTESVDNVVVAKETGNVINLYFNKLAAVSAADVTIDTTVVDGLTLPETVSVIYNDGSTKAAAAVWDAAPALEEGKTYTVNGKAEGLDVKAVINVFYTAELPDDYDQYDWVGNDKKYPVEKGSANQITNGDLTNGMTDWTRASDGAELAWEVVNNSEFTSGKAMHFTGTSTGGGGENTMRRFIKAEAGKSYYVSNKVYNSLGVATTDHGTTGMNAMVAVELDGTGFGAPKTSGVTIYSHVDNGGYDSWSAGGTADTNFVISGTIASREDGVYQPGINTVEAVIKVPETASNPYIMLSYGAWGSTGVYYGDFQMYEVASDECVDLSKKVKVTVTVDGVAGEPELVDKGSALPSYANLYPGALISIEGSTDEPNVNVTVSNEAPEFKSSIAIINGNAVIYAVGEAVAGKAVIAQYADGKLIDVVTKDVNVAAGTSAEIAITAAEGATAVRVMVVESLETMVPAVKSTSASAGSYAPAIITVSEEPQAKSGYVKEAMFDGDKENTRWTSDGVSDDDHHCWFILDFGKDITAQEIEFFFNNAASGRNTIFTLSVSKDGKEYTQVFDGKSEVNSAVISLAEAGSFRYIKYYGNGNDNTADPKWTAINEITIK